METVQGIAENYISIERGKRFSESILWSIHQEFFKTQGNKAWSDGFVPYYITSNPLIAKVYAEIILGYLQDFINQNKANVLSLKQPIYILELGSGSGLFAYNFVKNFFTMQKNLN